MGLAGFRRAEREAKEAAAKLPQDVVTKNDVVNAEAEPKAKRQYIRGTKPEVVTE